jgi:hypothetical protein
MATNPTATNGEVESAARRFGSNNDVRGWNNFVNTHSLTQEQLNKGFTTFNDSTPGRNQRSNTSSGNYNILEGPIPGKSYASDLLFKSSQSKSSISQVDDKDKVSAQSFRDAITSGQTIAFLAKEVGLQLEREAQLRTDINEKIGVSGKLSQMVQDTIIESESESLKFGYNMGDISKMYVSMADTSGRFNFMSQETLNKSFATSRAFVGTLDDLGKLMGEFEKIGLGSDDTIKSIDRTGRSSLSLGLNSKKTTELLKGDLGKLNEYGFKNGVDGLNRMVQKSVEFRMSMKEVFTIADKVMNPDGAIELAANLQVLGGAMGAFNDPMQMMYMATNNVEGLQDALIGAAGTLATFNTEQGKFEITGVNLRRAKEMAAQMGISYQELAKGAIAANERLLVTQDLAAKGFNLEEGDEEFIANLSQMKNGEMTISLPQDVAKKIGVAVSTPISQLTSEQITLLRENREELIQMNPEEIAKNQFSKIVNMDRNVESLANKFVRTNAATTKEEGIGGLDDILNKAVSNFNALYQRGENTGTDLEMGMKTAEAGLRRTLQAIGGDSGFISNAVNLLKDKLENESTRIRAEQIEREKVEKQKESMPAKNPVSYDGRVNSRIEVVFPQGYGTPPQAEVQNSYLTTYNA